MNARRINLMLWSAAACAALLALAGLVVGLAMRVNVEQAALSRGSANSGLSKPTTMSATALAEYEPVWSLPLRRPLTDQPALPATEPIAPQAVVASDNQGQMKLVGTVGDSLAMLQGADGNVELKAVGETAGGMKVLAIRPSQVDVQYNGRKVTLQKAKEQPGQ